MSRWPILFVLGGCAAPLPATSAQAVSSMDLEKPWAIPGETMEIEASLRGMTVGRIVTSTGRPGEVDGHRAVIVRARAQSVGLAALIADAAWEQTTTIDLDSGITLHETEEVWAKVPTQPAEHELRTAGPGESEYDQRDLLAAIAAVRAWHSQPGEHAHVRAQFERSTVPIDLVDSGHAYLVPAHQPAVRYDGTFNTRYAFTTWVSDDVARVPLRFETELPEHIGHLVLELTAYTAE